MADASASSDGEETAPGRIERLKDRYATVKTHGLERLETERERRASVRVAFDFYRRDQAFAGSLIAGGLSVKVFLWFLPFSLSFVVLLGAMADWFGRPPADLAEDAGLLTTLAGMVAVAVSASSRARLYLAVLGIVLLLWAGLGVVRALRLTSRLAWRVDSSKPVNRLAASLSVVGYVLAMIAIQRLTDRLQGGPWIIDLLVYLTAIVAIAALHVLVLDALPRADGAAPWTVVIPGALLLTAAWLIIRIATVVYFTKRLDSASELYGGLGMAGVFLAWLYIICRAFVAAISLNATIWQRDEAAEGPARDLTTGPAADS